MPDEQEHTIIVPETHLDDDIERLFLNCLSGTVYNPADIDPYAEFSQARGELLHEQISSSDSD